MTMPLVALREKAPNRGGVSALIRRSRLDWESGGTAASVGSINTSIQQASSGLAAAAEVFAELEEGVAEMRFAELFPSQRRGRG
jgi:hypothetical protein